MMAEGNQRRYPNNLNGVLQMAIGAQDPNASASAPTEIQQPMDEERRKWLHEAMSNMVVDEIKEMKEHLETLVDASKEDDDKEFSLEELANMCDRIDMAKDFQKIGGYEVLPLVLAHESCEVRWRAADLLATLVQNNPYCQDAAMQKGFLELLLNLLDTDEADIVRIKALYAISCLCRDYEPGLDGFVKNDGFSYLMRAMQCDVEKLQIKATFLLQAICTSKPACKDILCDIGMVEQLIGLLGTEHRQVHEHLTMALVSIATDHPRSIKDCQRPEFQLELILQERIEAIKGLEEYLEEKDYAEQLLILCFKTKSHGQDLER